MDDVRQLHPQRSLLFYFGLSLLGLGACNPDVVPNQKTLPRCDDVAKTCGPTHDEDCCAVRDVVGGLFKRVNDQNFPARVNDFQLDRYEVTVGRFREFVEDYPNSKPKAGDGAHKLIPGSGWNDAWNENLPANLDELQASVKCDANFRTWSDTAAGAENLPMNCVSWYVAFAFCAWDGGRLPTDAEWNYASAAGNEQRTYPWGEAPVDPQHAVYGCTGDNSAPDVCIPGADIVDVGSRSPAGDGKWGNADLSGSMYEWTIDWFNAFTTPCNDCANLDKPDPTKARTAWGGDWSHAGTQMISSFRLGFSVDKETPTQAFHGLRCARAK